MATFRKHRTLAEIRKSEIKLIHIAQTQLGWDDDTYRAAVRAASGGATDSSAKLDIKQRKVLLDHMKASGFKVKHARKAPLKNTNDINIGDDRDQVKKIRSLWIELHEFGEVRDNSERALAAYVKRITNKEHPRFLDLDEASNVIETLKKWQTRTLIAPFIALLNAPPKVRASTVFSVVNFRTGIDLNGCSKSDWERAQELIKVYQGKNHG